MVRIFPTSASGISVSNASSRAMISNGSTSSIRQCRLLFGYLGILLDIADRVLHGLDLLGFFIGNFEIESFFESHDEFYAVERVGAEVVNERCAGCDLALFHTELVHDDLLNFVFHPRHANSSSCIRDADVANPSRSEERRVGKEWTSTRSQTWS